MTSFLLRYATFFGVAIAFLLSLLLPQNNVFTPIVSIILGVLTLLGLLDAIQTKHAVLRNFPLLGRVRYFFEMIRPEIRQYLLEGDDEEVPFSRDARAIVYQRAKNVEDKRPFGTKKRVYESGYQWLTHSIRPVKIEDKDFRVSVGGPDCTQPYNLSIYNISAMSFGALSANAILALNNGARMGGFAHDTGEGGISRYHREGGGDLIYEIGTGYFGCRDDEGQFSPEQFAKTASSDQVKMIEIKLSQGAKPGHGGMLMAPKVTPEIAATRGVPEYQDVISPPRHSAFSTPNELLAFAAKLRDLSGGKPVGIKLCIGHPWEIIAIVKAMVDSGIMLDFITVDGAEGGTGAAPVEFSDHIGSPLRDALVFVDNCLRGAGLRDRVKIAASAKIISAYDIVRHCALGADWCNMARPFMFALGCIQARDCASSRCPSGVATMDPKRYRVLDVENRARRVFNFHQNSINAVAEMLEAAGLTHTSQLNRRHIVRRLSASQILLADQIYPRVEINALIDGKPVDDPRLASYWHRVSGDSFHPQEPAI